jgi:hypothetical protein
MVNVAFDLPGAEFPVTEALKLPTGSGCIGGAPTDVAFEPLNIGTSAVCGLWLGKSVRWMSSGPNLAPHSSQYCEESRLLFPHALHLIISLLSYKGNCINEHLYEILFYIVNIGS